MAFHRVLERPPRRLSAAHAVAHQSVVSVKEVSGIFGLSFSGPSDEDNGEIAADRASEKWNHF